MKQKFFAASAITEPRVPFDRILDRYARNKSERIRMRRAMLSVLQCVVHHGKTLSAHEGGAT